ncbi:urease accessory protein UreF [Niveibacterium microcysteis]|uniref:Urease accessory protein UreF n=1 Tax=Niveibacterium microcysteis TaxID=2811415 RepID=A0ABX7MAL6_9RHOO|nr:urease accessory protein UreF [Niveibacterium microcysteis]QSI77515.1 urease accessory protein UreF [Niveibacterium microcysteis]
MSSLAALTRLLHLASPALPVGAFSYSQGLEWAVECGWVSNEAQARDWIGDLMRYGIARCEAPALVAMMRAWRTGEVSEVLRLDAEFLATRESMELRAETVQMGYSCARLLRELESLPAFTRQALTGIGELSYPAAWSAAAAAWTLPPEDAVVAYLWAWLENQVMAAVKIVPLGQSAGQRLLVALGEPIPALARAAMTIGPDKWENFTPGLAWASAMHEGQYTRLFRS